jgi:UDP-N-acetylmuramate dehydrogenase
MSRHSSFRVGGPADILIIPGGEEDVAAVAALARDYETPLTVLGGGTNILVKDGGRRGITLKIGGGPVKITVMDDFLYCQAGAPLSAAAQKAADAGLSGLEFAFGIPGSVGGGVFMNAGAYGEEVKDLVEETLSMDLSGRKITRRADELVFGYRTSIFSQNGEIITGARFRLKEGERGQIKDKTNELLEKRRRTQPLDLPSAGSVFKRPPGNFAGKLIDGAGLRGLTAGGARVSEKHAGFIVNADKASAADILFLIDKVTEKVYKEFGVRLEPEIRIIGE